VSPIGFPDSNYVLHAIGWLELGNPAEAKAELGHINPELQTHPDVLELRWAICAEQQDWEEGLQVARSLLQQAPERHSAWLHQAYALRRVASGGLDQAWAALLPASEKFPEVEMIAYNLSCYACQMNQLDSARHWFRRAVSLGNKEKIRQRALHDNDLQALWDEIREL
jgi:tetratricopeptide (TPR) repeat protein